MQDNGAELDLEDQSGDGSAVVVEEVGLSAGPGLVVVTRAGSASPIGAAVVAAAAIAWPRAPQPETRVVRFAVAAPDRFFTRGAVPPFMLSPDGRHLAFLTESPRRALWVRSLDSSAARPLPGTENARILPFWSPDSQWLYFVAEDRARSSIWRLPVAGGAPKALVERAVKEFGRLDVMVNNAGASFRARPEEISLNGWNAVVQINLNGVFLGCKWAARQMFAQGGGGVIINLASIAGVYGSTMMSHYGAAKSAVMTLTRELAIAWARRGVRVNCIAPGPVETEGYLDVLHKTDPDADKTYRAVAARVAMGRWGRVEEIAYPAIFLASDASSFMTGETIIVDGGPSPRDAEG